jgi:hypothetical protein
MNFYDRYVNREDGRTIYNEIDKLGSKAFESENFAEIQQVLTETFHRVTYNLDIIYSELRKIDYAFKTEYKFNFEKPLLRPLPGTDELLITVDNELREFGQLPYSLKVFYKIVGACNFGWDYEKQPKMFWECADPIQIAGLDDVVSEISTDDWKEYLREGLQEGDYKFPHIQLAADYLHKDNISGGLPYSIQLTKEPCIDSLFLNESNETTFINYLRICMENCGFSRIAYPEHENDYDDFFNQVRPQLKMI